MVGKLFAVRWGSARRLAGVSPVLSWDSLQVRQSRGTSQGLLGVGGAKVEGCKVLCISHMEKIWSCACGVALLSSNRHSCHRAEDSGSKLLSSDIDILYPAALIFQQLQSYLSTNISDEVF